MRTPLREILRRRRAELRSEVARTVYSHRVALNLTQGQLARQAGLARETVVKIESRRSLPGEPTLRRLDTVLGRAPAGASIHQAHLPLQ